MKGVDLMSEIKCRDCELFDIESAKNKAGRVMRAWAVRCNWKSIEPYPISIFYGEEKRPSPAYVCADDGENCPCFKKRKE